MALFWSLFTGGGGSFLVDFLKNEILGFDKNLAVILFSDLLCCNYPRSVCVRTAQGNVNMVVYGKINALGYPHMFLAQATVKRRPPPPCTIKTRHPCNLKATKGEIRVTKRRRIVSRHRLKKPG